jgi:hypothetical protein
MHRTHPAGSNEARAVLEADEGGTGTVSEVVAELSGDAGNDLRQVCMTNSSMVPDPAALAFICQAGQNLGCALIHRNPSEGLPICR